MMDINGTRPTPIEIWLRQDNMAISCMEVHEDETTYHIDIKSLSMRGAQREISGYLIQQGYEPVGRWQVEHEDETSRKFRLLEPFEKIQRDAVKRLSPLNRGPR
jgi:hypothetical protein